MAVVHRMRTKEEIQQEEEREIRRHKEAKRNLNFIQVGRRFFGDLQRLIRTCPAGAELLFFFAEHMNPRNRLSAGYKELVEATGLSRSTLSAAVQVLAAEKWIKIDKSGGRNTYEINALVFWAAARNLKGDVFQSGTVQIRKKKPDTESEKKRPRVYTKSIAVVSLRKTLKSN